MKKQSTFYLTVFISCIFLATGCQDLSVDDDSANSLQPAAPSAAGGGQMEVCNLPNHFAGTGELGFWACDNNDMPVTGREVSVMYLLNGVDEIDEHPSCYSTNKFNWNANVESSGAVCSPSQALKNNRVYMVYIPGRENSYCGGGECGRFIAKWQLNSSVPASQTVFGPDIWGFVYENEFGEIRKDGATWIKTEYIPKANQFVRYNGYMSGANTFVETDNFSTLNLNWTESDALNVTRPQAGEGDVDIVGVHSGGVFKVYDVSF